MKPITGRFVLVALVAFFGAVFAVNATFFLFARASWPGLSADSAYARGIAFNHTLKESRDQQAQAWTVTLEYATGGTLRVVVQAMDRRPVPALMPVVELRAFGHPERDRSIALAGEGDGAYQARASLDPGRWQASLQLHDAAGVVRHRAIQEIWVRP